MTVNKINREEVIYGPSITNIQGQMIRYMPPIYEKKVKVPLPPIIADRHHEVALPIEFFYVNNVSDTKSHKINFISAQYWSLRLLRTSNTGLEIVQSNYSGGSFNISDYHADRKFDKAAIKDFLVLAIHIYERHKHVGPIDRLTHTIKCTRHICLYMVGIIILVYPSYQATYEVIPNIFIYT